jgi:hypothetical protein
MTTREDIFGCEVTLSASGDLDAWNAMQLGFLSHAAATPDDLSRTLTGDPGFALPVICKGFFCLLLARRELVDSARQSERDARALIQTRPVTAREIIFLDALGAWNAGLPSLAAEKLNHLTQQNPRDALAMKLVQAIRFVLGDATGMRAAMEAIIPHMGPDHRAYGYALGCHAFALEETGEYKLAERIGREGVLHSPDDAWGLHAVAHVYDMTNDTDAGLAWLSKRTRAWAHCNNFRYHVWWHMALMYLDRGDIDAVYALYDDHIRADKTDDYRDISNAASLLSRLELDGHHVGRRWEELAHLSRNRVQDGCLAFADLHYVLSLIGGSQKSSASQLIRRIRKDAITESGEMGAIMKYPGLTVAQGLEAFGQGNYSLAFKHLAGTRDALQSIGGSHAQRDVFEQLTIEAALRGGYLNAAQRFLDIRARQRGGKLDRFARTRLDELARQQLTGTTEVLVPAE